MKDCVAEALGSSVQLASLFGSGATSSTYDGQIGDIPLHSARRRLLVHMRCRGFLGDLAEPPSLECAPTFTPALAERSEVAVNEQERQRWRGLFRFADYEIWLAEATRRLCELPAEQHTPSVVQLITEVRRVCNAYSWEDVSEPCRVAWGVLAGQILLDCEGLVSHLVTLSCFWLLYHQLLSPLTEEPDSLASYLPASHRCLVEVVLRTVMMKTRLLGISKSRLKVACEPDAMHTCFTALQFFQRLDAVTSHAFLPHILVDPHQMEDLAEFSFDVAPELLVRALCCNMPSFSLFTLPLHSSLFS